MIRLNSACVIIEIKIIIIKYKIQLDIFMKRKFGLSFPIELYIIRGSLLYAKNSSQVGAPTSRNSLCKREIFFIQMIK